MDKRDIMTYVGAAIVYISAILMMILLPLKLIPQQQTTSSGQDPNVVNNNNYLPSSCPLYTIIANSLGTPYSQGPLRLPLQRPREECRTFTSFAMEKLINNMTSRMVDKDLARLFENAYPNTLGIYSPIPSNHRYYDIMVQSRRFKSTILCHHWRHSSAMAERCIPPIHSIPSTATLRRQPKNALPRPHKSRSKTYFPKPLLQCIPAPS